MIFVILRCVCVCVNSLCPCVAVSVFLHKASLSLRSSETALPQTIDKRLLLSFLFLLFSWGNNADQLTWQRIFPVVFTLSNNSMVSCVWHVPLICLDRQWRRGLCWSWGQWVCSGESDPQHRWPERGLGGRHLTWKIQSKWLKNV